MLWRGAERGEWVQEAWGTETFIRFGEGPRRLSRWGKGILARCFFKSIEARASKKLHFGRNWEKKWGTSLKFTPPFGLEVQTASADGHTSSCAFSSSPFHCTPDPTSVWESLSTVIHLHSHPFLELCLGRGVGKPRPRQQQRWVGLEKLSDPFWRLLFPFRLLHHKSFSVSIPVNVLRLCWIWNVPSWTLDSTSYSHFPSFLNIGQWWLVTPWSSGLLCFPRAAYTVFFPPFLNLPPLTHFLLPLTWRIGLNLISLWPSPTSSMSKPALWLFLNGFQI